MFDLAQSLNQLNLNDTEIGLFCAIVLATPGLYSVYTFLKSNGNNFL